MNHSIEEAVKTNHPVIIVEEKDYEYNGNKRKHYIVKKKHGKKHYMVFGYENGTYSDGITY